jgi:hypothetical protein
VAVEHAAIAWVPVSLVGIDLITVEARVVVASTDTCLKYSEAVSLKYSVENDDDDDDDGGEGSSGAPVIVQRPLDPRRRPPSRPERTRRNNGRVDVLGRCKFYWRSSPLATGRRLDITADEPSAEPPGSDLLHWR